MNAPARPSGSGPHARFVQWVWDRLANPSVALSRGARVSQSAHGAFVEPLLEETGSSRVRQFLLTDASNGDYFVCRALKVDAEGALTIGTDDLYVAKPFQLRQSPFDGLTYDIEVESWNGSVLSTETHSLSSDYKSATFRIVTDEDEELTENQTIIPRFVPAVLDEPEDEPVTTDTISPTIIYGVSCSGLGITRPDDPELPEEEQTPMAVTLVALNDSWAWMKTD